jgi:hypothetical protein
MGAIPPNGFMEVEYEITPDDLYAFQWRAAYASPRAWRTRRKAYVFWLLSLLIISVLPAIGTDGFSISRVNYTFFLIAFPLAALGQWFLERRLSRRALLQLLQQERPGRGHGHVIPAPHSASHDGLAWPRATSDG